MAGGVLLGLIAPHWAERLEFLSTLFLRLIRSIVAPVLVGVLIRAVAGAGSMGALGRIGWKSAVCFETATTAALLLGWFTVLAARPGESLTLGQAGSGDRPEPSGLTDALESAVPTSIVDALARGDVLQIVAFCFLFGVACLSVGEKARPVVELADSLAEIAFRYTDYVMLLAPPAVFAAAANAVAGGGSGALGGLAAFAGSAWFAQGVFLALLTGGLILFGVPLRRFAHYARQPFLIGFATTSSAAALPQTLENLQSFGIPRRILGVAAPLSLSLNLNGSTIHLGMATLFVAQAAGIRLSMEQQVVILLTLKLMSKGVAGVPRANFVILAAVFESSGLPLEGLAVLLGVDALIDPIRTSVNVAGHCAAPAVVARWEGVSFPAGQAASPPEEGASP